MCVCSAHIYNVSSRRILSCSWSSCRSAYFTAVHMHIHRLHPGESVHLLPPPPRCVCCGALRMMCSARLVCERSRLHALHVRVAAEPTPNRKLCVNARLASCLAWLLKTMSRVQVCCERHACVLSYHHAGIRASQPSACALIASTLAKACICSSLPLRCVRCGVFRMMCGMLPGWCES